MEEEYEFGGNIVVPVGSKNKELELELKTPPLSLPVPLSITLAPVFARLWLMIIPPPPFAEVSRWEEGNDESEAAVNERNENVVAKPSQ